MVGGQRKEILRKHNRQKSVWTCMHHSANKIKFLPKNAFYWRNRPRTKQCTINIVNFTVIIIGQ